MISETELSSRPPWPDELARIWKFIGQSHFTGRVYPRIAVTGKPERIIATGALEVTEEKTARLHLFIRGRFCRQEVVNLFLHDSEAIAEKEGIENVTLIIPEAAPWRPLLENAGYTRGRTDEWWTVPWTEAVKKRLRVAERLVNSPKLSEEFTASPPTSDDFTDMHVIAHEHGLANLERLGIERILGSSKECQRRSESGVNRAA